MELLKKRKKREKKFLNYLFYIDSRVKQNLKLDDVVYVEEEFKRKTPNPFMEEIKNNKEEFEQFLVGVYNNQAVKKYLGEIKDINSYLNAYKKIVLDKKFLNLLEKIKSIPELWKHLQRFDLIVIYLMLKVFLPLLVAGGFGREKIVKFFLFFDYEDYEEFLKFLFKHFERIRKFLFYFATPDGIAVEILLKGLFKKQ